MLILYDNERLKDIIIKFVDLNVKITAMWSIVVMYKRKVTNPLSLQCNFERNKTFEY